MVKSPMRTFCSFVVADKMNITNKTLVWPTGVKGLSSPVTDQTENSQAKKGIYAFLKHFLDLFKCINVLYVRVPVPRACLVPFLQPRNTFLKS